MLPANPIVIRVVQMASKRPAHLWVRAGYLLALLFVMLAAQVAQPTAGGSLGAMAKASSRVFEYISILQLVMICLLAPVFTAGAISQEKDAETFNVLLTTPLTNAQIVLGSMLSRLFFVIALLVAGLPVFGITMLYGGVTAEQIFLSFGVAACTALVMGSLAILISVVRVGTRSTVFSFYLAVALYMIGGLVLGSLTWTHVAASIPPGGTSGMTWLAPMHPIWSLWVALDRMHAPEPAALGAYNPLVAQILARPAEAYMLLRALFSIAVVAAATFFVRRGIRQGEQGWWTRLLPRRGTDGEGEKTRRARRVWANPVAWREAVTRGNAAASGVVRYGFIGCGAAAGLILLFNYWKGEFGSVTLARTWLSGLVLVEFATVLLLGINTAAVAITRERESGTLELLLTTPLTQRYIIRGKLRGLISFTLPLLAVPAATLLLAAVADAARGVDPPIVLPEQAIILPVLMVVYSAFSCMLGLYMSLRCVRSVQAVLTSVSILLGLGFGLGLCGAGFLGSGVFGALIAPVTFVISLYAMLETGAGSLTPDLRVAMAVGSVFAAVLYGGIVTGLYKTMLREFDMTIRKQSR